LARSAYLGQESAPLPAAKSGRQLWRRLSPYVWVAPAIIALAALVAYPSVYALVLSFYKWNLTRPQVGRRFVGLDNYAKAIHDEVFLETVRNTVVFVVGSVTIEFVLGIFLALVLSQKLPGVRLARALIITPTMVAPVIAGLIGRYMFFSGYGIVPYLLEKVGIVVSDGILATPGVAMAAVILIDVWQWTPFVILVVAAGLQSLSNEPIEAAQVDGASSWQILYSITLPMLKRVLLVVLLLRIMDAVKTFDIIYATTRGGPGNTTMTVTYFGFQQGLNFFEMGYAAAISFMILISVVILSQAFIRGVYRGAHI